MSPLRFAVLVLLLLCVPSLVPAATIRGYVINSFTNQPIDPTESPFTRPLVSIWRQGDDIGEPLYAEPLAKDGHFVVENLAPNTYLVRVEADATFTRFDSGLFLLKPGATKDFGTIKLVPPPILIGEVTFCEVLTANFKCPFTVELINTTPQRLLLRSWAHVFSISTQTVIAMTQYSFGDQDFALAPGRRKLISLPLSLGGPATPNEMTACVDIYVGQRSPGNGVRYNTVGHDHLFCVNKGDALPTN